MSRSIQKKWFGQATTPGSQIVVSGVKFADGTTATSDFIIKQTGSAAYIVQDSAQAHAAEIVFMVNATDVSGLNPGECFILATPFGGSARPCKKIAQYRLSLYEADGTISSYSWSTQPATVAGQCDLIAGAGAIGAVLTLTLGVAGFGYFSAPAVSFTGGGSGGTAHTTVAAGAVATIVLDTAGYGYSGVTIAAPTASVTATATGTQGFGATGAITGYTGLVGGGYYLAAPAGATITAPPASVTATAAGTATAGAVDAIVTVTLSGGYYNVAPTVSVVGGNADATAHSTVANGVVTGVVIDAPGTGYTTPVAFTIGAPDVVGTVASYSGSTLVAGAVATFTGLVGGTGYYGAAPTLTAVAAPPAAVQATATATFSV